MDPRTMNESQVHTGRTILTALYLCMLGVCFLVPIFFYFRMHCDDRRNQNLRDLEIAGMTQAMNESQAQQREESRAARKKYREERRARIIQLFTPVRMTLTEENFQKNESAIDDENKNIKQSAIILDGLEDGASCKICPSDAKGDYIDDGDVDEFILLPKPGLPHGAAIYEFNTNTNSFSIASNHSKTNQQQDNTELRKVPNECSICLCEYTIGSDIVWSSNPQCDHVFHTKCIEQWLMKQRDGPLCPCCRRDFVIDPFDFGSGETEDLEKGAAHAVADDAVIVLNASTSTDEGHIETTPDGVEETVVAVSLTESSANIIVRMVESDDSV